MIKKNYSKIIIPFLTLLLTCPSIEAQQVSIGTDSALSVFSPICRTKDYCVYEIIYLNSEIGMPGNMTDFAFYRADGSNVDPIENISLFMKHTSDAQLSAGNYSENGYQLVYQGIWPNDTGAGWREVPLTSPFVYDGINNLQVLVLKGFQTAVANQPVAPRWTYSTNSSGSNRVRRYYNNTAVDSTTSLTTTNFNANARLNFGTVGIKEISNTAINVFPNPAHDKLFVNLGQEFNSELIDFYLYNYNGSIVYHESIRNNSAISLVGYASGIYFYTLKVNDQFRSGKLVVN